MFNRKQLVTIRRFAVYASRLPFHVKPGQTSESEQHLVTLKEWVAEVGGHNCRILLARFASNGSPDLILEQESQT